MRERCGHSLVEVLVALVLLQVGLLGAAGMVVTASRAVAGAAGMDRALVEASAVADSLHAAGWGGDGERIAGPLAVRWSVSGDWALVEVRSREGKAEPLVRVPVPLEAPWP